MSDPFDEIALRAAINVLRDSVESGQMPSGLALAGDAADLHCRAADQLVAMRQNISRSFPAEASLDASRYQRGIEWIVLHDAEGTEGHVSFSVSTALLADIFGVSTDKVAADVTRCRRENWKG